MCVLHSNLNRYIATQWRQPGAKRVLTAQLKKLIKCLAWILEWDRLEAEKNTKQLMMQEDSKTREQKKQLRLAQKRQQRRR